MSCLPGQVFRDLCVSCPVGTYALGNVCLMAPKGSLVFPGILSMNHKQRLEPYHRPGFYVSTSASTSYLPCSHAPIEGAASCNSGKSLDCGSIWVSGTLIVASIIYL